VKDQRQHWNNAHEKQWLHAHSQHQSDFAEEVNSIIPKGAKILELGCGEGNDSIYFADEGHEVTATDFSDIVIAQNQKRYNNANLHFAEQDISQQFNYPDDSFDVVYARLSLHYFPDSITRTIFEEIERVLKPGGVLHFMCKSTSDGIYGKGEKIESDMYELDGHIRHFFSEAYTAKLASQAGLTELTVVAGEDMLYDRKSAFIKASAKKG
jgi:ubiquinone/menaquinone biosynthesis C-methylase UbiE